MYLRACRRPTPTESRSSSKFSMFLVGNYRVSPLFSLFVCFSVGGEGEGAEGPSCIRPAGAPHTFFLSCLVLLQWEHAHNHLVRPFVVESDTSRGRLISLFNLVLVLTLSNRRESGMRIWQCSVPFNAPRYLWNGENWKQRVGCYTATKTYLSHTYVHTYMTIGNTCVSLGTSWPESVSNNKTIFLLWLWQ